MLEQNMKDTVLWESEEIRTLVIGNDWENFAIQDCVSFTVMYPVPRTVLRIS